MKELSHTDSTLFSMQESAERFEVLANDTGARSEQFQQECRDLTKEIETLKRQSIFDK